MSQPCCELSLVGVDRETISVIDIQARVAAVLSSCLLVAARVKRISTCRCLWMPS